MSFPREWNLKEGFKDGKKDSQMHTKNDKTLQGKYTFLFSPFLREIFAYSTHSLHLVFFHLTVISFY